MKVVNIRSLGPGWTKDKRYLYIGRKNSYYGVEESLLHNPIVLGKRCPECFSIHSTKGSTLQCFEKRLTRELEDPEFRKKVMDLLEGVEYLVCWCAPGPCHGEVILRLIGGE